jgi:hypothetical protein
MTDTKFALPKAACFPRNDDTRPPFCDSLQGSKHCIAAARIPNDDSHHADNYPIDKSEEKNCLYKLKKCTRVFILSTRVDVSGTRVDVSGTCADVLSTRADVSGTRADISSTRVFNSGTRAFILNTRVDFSCFSEIICIILNGLAYKNALAGTGKAGAAISCGLGQGATPVSVLAGNPDPERMYNFTRHGFEHCFQTVKCYREAVSAYIIILCAVWFFALHCFPLSLRPSPFLLRASQPLAKTIAVRPSVFATAWYEAGSNPCGYTGLLHCVRNDGIRLSVCNAQNHAARSICFPYHGKPSRREKVRGCLKSVNA